MSKVLISMTLDSELASKLRKENNYSGLINGLCEDYYNSKKLTTEQDLWNELKDLGKEATNIHNKAELIKKQYNELKQKNIKIKELIPVGVADELREFDKMTSFELRTRYIEHYQEHHDFSFDDLKEAWDLMHNSN